MAKPVVVSLFGKERFEDRFPGIPLSGHSVSLFVECSRYSLQIPVSGQAEKPLDIFEETILRMIQLKKCDLDELADVLCLKKDLVNFIRMRLMEKGLLLDATHLSEEGKMLLLRQSKTREDMKYQPGSLFVLRKTGMALPWIQTGALKTEQVDEANAWSITLGYGTPAEPYYVKGRRVNSDRGGSLKSVLKTGELRKYIRRYNQICKAAGSKQIALNEEYGIESSREAGSVYFHLQAAVQEGNVDELIFSDGFVTNIDGMMDYMQQENGELLNEIRAKAIVMYVDGAGGLYDRSPAGSQDEESDSGNDAEGEAGESAGGGGRYAASPRRYGQIRRRYEEALRLLGDGSDDLAGVDQRREADSQRKALIQQCYYMLEWGFYCHVLERPLSGAMREFFAGRPVTENADTLLEFAESMGIRGARSCRNLFSHLDAKKVESASAGGRPTLYADLPLAIAGAKENPDSEIFLLSSGCRDFLPFISYINDNSASLRHDSDADVDRNPMGSQEILTKTVKILNLLLPELRLGKEQRPETDEPRSSASQERLLSRVSLEKVLGSACFSAMSAGLKDDWIRISPDRTGSRLPAPAEYAGILYRILQTELSQANEEFHRKGARSKEEALAVLRKRHGKPLPRSFTTVRDEMYLQATQGRKTSLGAEAIVYAANVEDGAAAMLKELHFVEVLDQILTLRNHNPDLAALNEDEESMCALRDKVVRLTRVIT